VWRLSQDEESGVVRFADAAVALSDFIEKFAVGRQALEVCVLDKPPHVARHIFEPHYCRVSFDSLKADNCLASFLQPCNVKARDFLVN
jgi:hypothetical protein